MRTPQYWLAELDQWDNPTLIDGSHSTEDGPRRAAAIIRTLGLGRPGRRFAIARVELVQEVSADYAIGAIAAMKG